MTAPTHSGGLPMPVFSAFGWAGEENAINFALSVLEQFIADLHLHLSPEARSELPYFGLDRDSQTIYLAAKREVEEGPYIAFLARPLNFEMRLTVTDKAVINRGLRAAERQPKEWYRYLTQLGEDWYFHLQQNHVEEEGGESSFYQDLFKDNVLALDEETCQQVTSRAAFLNSEPSWITPVSISLRIPSERAAGMNQQILDFLAGEIDRMMPILFLFTHKKGIGKSRRKRKTRAASPSVPVEADTVTTFAPKVPQKSFSYLSELKPLHIRKGFINLTPRHWSFFANKTRSETRDVTLFFDGTQDDDCSVWRLQSNDMTRIMLSERARMWVEKTFDPDSFIQVEATRLGETDIRIKLTPPE